MTTTRTRLWAPPRPQPTYDAWLTDDQIQDAARRAFAPHRCNVSFRIDGSENTRKVTLRIVVADRKGDKAFLVEGGPMDLLWQSVELRLYLDDVRVQLEQRGVVFASAGERRR